MTPQEKLAPYRLSAATNVDGLDTGFAERLYRLLSDPRLEHRVHIVSGYRTYAQQADLYARWKAGTYDVPAVAKPGTSRHESGRAADLGIGWGTKFGWSHVHQVSGDYGLHYPVRGEAWHVETNPNAAEVTVVSPTRLDVLVRGSDDAVWHRWYGIETGVWTDWESLGGQCVGAPAGCWFNGGFHVFVRGVDDGMWQRSWTPAGWGAWVPHAGVLTSSPAVAVG